MKGLKMDNLYKIKDGIIGLAIGDALGVPGEFKDREELKNNPITDTIATITGSLLGIYYGFDRINDKWKKLLKKYDYIIDMCKEFQKIFDSINYK